jgi:ubiquinone biosynthesis protein UbiJ
MRIHIQGLLTPVVGDFIARTSVSMASKRIGKTPDTITEADANALAEALRPALRTVVGNDAAERLVEQIRSLGTGSGQ